MRRIIFTCFVIVLSIGMANCMPTFRYHFRQVEVGDAESAVFGLPKEVKLQGKPSEILDSLAEAGFKLIIPAKFLRAHYVPRPDSDDATINAAIEVIIVPLKVGQKKAGWACKDKRADPLACAMFNDWIRHHLTWKGPGEFKSASETIEPRISLHPKTKGKTMDVDRLLHILFSNRLSFAPGTDFLEAPYLEGNLHNQKHRIGLSFVRESDSDPMSTKRYDPATEKVKAEISAALVLLPPGLDRHEIMERLPPEAEALACQLGSYTEMAQENGFRGMAVWSSGDRTVEISWQGLTGGPENSGSVGVTIKPNDNLRSEQLRQYLIKQLGIDPATSVLTYEILDSPPR
ncbi:hypothetical protein ACFL2F_03570, partial [Myxococcota bacterium]